MKRKSRKEEEQDEKKDVAVNKLFDILRKGGKKEGSSGKIGEAVSEDDIIGDLYGDEEDDEEDELEEEIIEEEEESKWYQRRKQRLKRSVGSYPANVSTPPLKKKNYSWE